MNTLQLNDLIAATGAANYFDAMPQEIQNVIFEEKIELHRRQFSDALKKIGRDYRAKLADHEATFVIENEFDAEWDQTIRDLLRDENSNDCVRVENEYENNMPDECQKIIDSRRGFIDCDERSDEEGPISY